MSVTRFLAFCLVVACAADVAPAEGADKRNIDQYGSHDIGVGETHHPELWLQPRSQDLTVVASQAGGALELVADELRFVAPRAMSASVEDWIGVRYGLELGFRAYGSNDEFQIIRPSSEEHSYWKSFELDRSTSSVSGQWRSYRQSDRSTGNTLALPVPAISKEHGDIEIRVRAFPVDVLGQIGDSFLLGEPVTYTPRVTFTDTSLDGPFIDVQTRRLDLDSMSGFEIQGLYTATEQLVLMVRFTDEDQDGIADPDASYQIQYLYDDNVFSARFATENNEGGSRLKLLDSNGELPDDIEGRALLMRAAQSLLAQDFAFIENRAEHYPNFLIEGCVTLAVGILATFAIAAAVAAAVAAPLSAGIAIVLGDLVTGLTIGAMFGFLGGLIGGFACGVVAEASSSLIRSDEDEIVLELAP